MCYDEQYESQKRKGAGRRLGGLRGSSRLFVNRQCLKLSSASLKSSSRRVFYAYCSRHTPSEHACQLCEFASTQAG